MPLNPADYLSDLAPADPLPGDPAAQADDHLRAIKKAISQTFPNGFEEARDVTQDQLNGFAARIVALEATPPPASYVSPVLGHETISAAGDHPVTGLGFQPAVVMFFAFGESGNGEMQLSVGISGAGVLVTHHMGRQPTNFPGFQGYAAGSTTQDAYVILEGGAKETLLLNRGNVKSLDADGFTLTHTQVSATPTTTRILWIAFK